MSIAPSTVQDSVPDLPQWVKDLFARAKSRPQWKLWSPPEDPDKLYLPYLLGFTAQIYRHNIAGTEPRPRLPVEYLKTVTHTESIVANPPVET